MIAPSRERRRSACPLSRRSFGFIVPSDATTESRHAIRRNPENEIASFWALTARKLAISNLSPIQKSTPAQWLGRFFTDDVLVESICPRTVLPSPLVGEGGAKRRMRG